MDRLVPIICCSARWPPLFGLQPLQVPFGNSLFKVVSPPTSRSTSLSPHLHLLLDLHVPAIIRLNNNRNDHRVYAGASTGINDELSVWLRVHNVCEPTSHSGPPLPVARDGPSHLTTKQGRPDSRPSGRRPEPLGRDELHCVRHQASSTHPPLVGPLRHE